MAPAQKAVITIGGKVHTLPLNTLPPSAVSALIYLRCLASGHILPNFTSKGCLPCVALREGCLTDTLQVSVPVKLENTSTEARIPVPVTTPTVSYAAAVSKETSKQPLTEDSMESLYNEPEPSTSKSISNSKKRSAEEKQDLFCPVCNTRTGVKHIFCKHCEYSVNINLL